MELGFTLTAAPPSFLGAAITLAQSCSSVSFDIVSSESVLSATIETEFFANNNFVTNLNHIKDIF